jgi:hypothetical protein
MDPLVINRYTFTITCYNSAGVSRSDSVFVNVNPDYGEIGGPVVNLEVRPVGGGWGDNATSVDYGESAELRWTIENVFIGTTCEASGDWSGSRSAAGGIQSTGNLTSAKSYTLTCTGPGGADSDNVVVGVRGALAPTLSLQAAFTNVDYGESTQLTWTSTDTTSCTASGDWRGTRPVNGNSSTGNLTSHKSYTLECTGPGGTISRSVSINVGNAPPVTVQISAKPAGESTYDTGDITIDYGTAADIRWEVTGAVRCEASGGNWSGLRSEVGGTYRTQGLIQNSSYQITCYNADGNNETASVDVSVNEQGDAPPIVFTNPIEQGDLGGILNSVSGLIRMIAISLAGIMIIVSGIIILTSIDNRERLNKGKNMLKWSLIGLAIALASSFIIGFIQELVN